MAALLKPIDPFVQLAKLAINLNRAEIIGQVRALRPHMRIFDGRVFKDLAQGPSTQFPSFNLLTPCLNVRLREFEQSSRSLLDHLCEFGFERAANVQFLGPWYWQRLVEVIELIV